MSEHPWIAAAKLLHRHYGSQPAAGPPFAWRTLVEVVIEGVRTRKGPTGRLPIEESPLDSPGATAAASLDALTDALKELRRSTRHAPVLSALARWWLRDPRRAAEQPAAWEQPIEKLHDELRVIRGVRATLADRILLHVGELTVFPVDRATMRVVCRHGWLDPTADYDEWQAFCAVPEAQNPIDLALTSAHINRLGREHCGPSPKCEGCPLATLLPANGPLCLEADEQID